MMEYIKEKIYTIKSVLTKLKNILVKKRVLLVTDEYTNTGAPRTLLYMSEVLKSKNYEVFVYCDKHGVLENEFRKRGVYIWSFHSAWFGLLYVFMNVFSLVVCNTIGSYKLLKFFQTNKFLRCIWWLHECEFLDQYISIKPKAKKVLTKARNVFCVSDYCQKYVLRYNPRAKILNFGIKDDYEKYKSFKKTNKDKFTILCPGTINYNKGQDRLFEAFKSLGNDYTGKCEVNFVGVVPQAEFAENLMDEASIFGNVKFTGEVSHSDMMKIMSVSDFVILPFRCDAYPTAAMEALMLDKMLIMSDKTGISNFIHDGYNGFLFNKTERLTQILKNLIDNPDLKKVGRARELYEKNFTQERFREDIEKLFDKYYLEFVNRA